MTRLAMYNLTCHYDSAEKILEDSALKGESSGTVLEKLHNHFEFYRARIGDAPPGL